MDPKAMLIVHYDPTPSRFAAAAGRRNKAPEAAKVLTTGRNDRCPCGSGKKFKRCCLRPTPPAEETL